MDAIENSEIFKTMKRLDHDWMTEFCFIQRAYYI